MADDDDDDAMDEDAGGIDVDTDGALTTHTQQQQQHCTTLHATGGVRRIKVRNGQTAPTSVRRTAAATITTRFNVQPLFTYSVTADTFFGGGALFLTVVCPFIRLSVNSILKTSSMGEFS